MRLLSMFEKFRDVTPEVGGQKAGPGRMPRIAVHHTKQHWSDREELLNDLERYLKTGGWRYLGGGHFSWVFENPNNPMVMKLTATQDRGYTRFYSMAKRSDNPHFPEVGRMGLINVPMYSNRDENRKFYAVMIEKLQERNDTWASNLAQYCTVYLTNPEGYEKSTSDPRYPPSPLNQYPGMIEALDMFKPFLRKGQDDDNSYYPDFKVANIMWRGDVPVITDPLWTPGDA